MGWGGGEQQRCSQVVQTLTTFDAMLVRSCTSIEQFAYVLLIDRDSAICCVAAPQQCQCHQLANPS
jgi:hypothetical protein